MPPGPLFAYANAPGSAVHLHVLLTGIQTGALSLLADALEIATLAVYLWGVRRLAHRGRSWPLWSTAAFASGVAVLWIATGSGLAAYDDVNVTLHVVQHVLLMMVAPPLIALGKPVTLAIQSSGRAGQLRILKVVHSPIVAFITFPVIVWFLYYGTMYTYFMTGVYPYSIAHPLFHDGTHLWFFLVGYLFWHPLVGLDPARWRWSGPVRAVSLFIGMPFEAFLGIGISQLSQPLAPINSIANTHAAGETFWILSMAVTGTCLAVVILQWWRQLERDGVREDRQVERAAVENRSRAARLGIDVPPGLTVPWWRLEELEARQVGTVGTGPGSEEQS